MGDFGLAKSLGSTTYYKKDQDNTNNYRTKWASPELLEYGKFSVKSDVWSFGVSLWELYSNGKDPFATLSNFEAIQEVVRGNRMNMPENCPPEVWLVIQQCWEQKPANRPTFREIVEKFVCTSPENTLSQSNSNNNHSTDEGTSYTNLVPGQSTADHYSQL